jgi:hypothetical protein
VAVTVGVPEGEENIRFDIEFTPERPFGTDHETWTDGVFVLMAGKPDVDERGILAMDHYLTGTHGVTLPMQLEAGAFLVYGEEMHEGAVDVDVEGPVLSFTLEREGIGDPSELYFQVLLGVERDGAEEGDQMEGDSYPELGEPPAFYRVAAG